MTPATRLRFQWLLRRLTEPPVTHATLTATAASPDRRHRDEIIEHDLRARLVLTHEARAILQDEKIRLSGVDLDDQGIRVVPGAGAMTTGGLRPRVS